MTDGKGHARVKRIFFYQGEDSDARMPCVPEVATGVEEFHYDEDGNLEMQRLIAVTPERDPQPTDFLVTTHRYETRWDLFANGLGLQLARATLAAGLTQPGDVDRMIQRTRRVRKMLDTELTQRELSDHAEEIAEIKAAFADVERQLSEHQE